MTRKFIPMSQLNIFTDGCHTPNGMGFDVDAAKDGQTKEQHREGIDYIKTVLSRGQKVLPILVVDNEDGTYDRLDGFKRAWAHKELGEEFIEAFVATFEEGRRVVEIPYGNHVIRAEHGGLPKEHYPLFEGLENDTGHYDDTIFLFKSPHGNGLRIEVCEAIHIHWGEVGRYRFTLGRRDFEELAEAISKL